MGTTQPGQSALESERRQSNIQNHQDSTSNLLRNLLHFGCLLRSLGIAVAPAQLADLAHTLTHIGLQRRDDVKAAARALLISHHEHQALFDLAFDLFWQQHNRNELAQLDLRHLMPPFPAQTQSKTHKIIRTETDGAAEGEPDEGEHDRTERYSHSERLRQVDFAKLSDDEIAAVKALMHELTWQPPLRRSRRQERRSSGHALDLRRTVRASLPYGGEALRLHRRGPKQVRRPLVILCDVSGSMERYARLLLQFIYAISRRLDRTGIGRVEVFAFSTRLTRLTPSLRRRSIDAALDEAVRHVYDWAGGTRIGAALHEFNFVWGRRVLGGGAIVLVISDGWDRGDIELLSSETARLQRTAYQLLWLNPRLGAPGYEPLVRGIQAILPYVDGFLPVHNLASLEQLAALLENGLPAKIGPLPAHAWLPGQQLRIISMRT